MIGMQQHPEGTILAVRAQPGARKSGVIGEQNGALKIAVTAPADDGRANKALTELLRDVLGIRRSQVELVQGAKSRDKRFLVRGLSRADMETRLAELLKSD